MKKTATLIAILGLTMAVWAQDPIEQFTDDQDHVTNDYDLYYEDVEYNDAIEPMYRQSLAEEDLQVELFPNPVTDNLIVRLECGCDFENVRFTVLDYNGVQVYSVRGEVMHEGVKRLVIPFTELSKGNYYLLIHFEGGVVTRKIVKA
jgi:hypothetical protein